MTTLSASVGATPTPPHAWRNRTTPRVATRPQSLQRGRKGTTGKFAAGTPRAQPAWLANERALEPSSFVTGRRERVARPKRARRRAGTLGCVRHACTALPADSTDLRWRSTWTGNGGTPAALFLSGRSRKQVTRPEARVREGWPKKPRLGAMPEIR
jgi:hypothetical protein